MFQVRLHGRSGQGVVTTHGFGGLGLDEFVARMRPAAAEAAYRLADKERGEG